MEERHVLAVYPHPDDETFGKAGTIALYTQAGVPVTLICGTLGQMGRNMGKPFFATRETLPIIREQELRNACSILGIQDLRLLGLRDKTVEFEDPEELADKIFAVIQEVNPSVILTYYPEYGVHPDHNAMSAATVLAVKRLPREARPKIYASPIVDNPRKLFGPPDVVFDVTPVLDIKLAAIRAHRSQSEAMMARWEKEAEASPEARKRWEQWMGTEQYWIYPVD
ncbi:putative N-acetyl-alpha-D-glucosaminyl L-malate deacetylase 2 [Alicyclobacillus contaminans]|uniref:bacillithiol biosynthesis deacetylase BshB2 n=1 Tax=Alicyclobacillus contaminans TaxID=392016 RepID=UPI00040C3FE6|nr:bacillithiol biosynthesis deacetylase BshB2 [Alicyclobacillus contaminans]GMA49754.1 putative N-acetyl-alpha-D-glucosaminyl L-malate deacetylase 2 [Alicyclobacillus contaminans]